MRSAGDQEVDSWHDANLDVHYPEVYLCQDPTWVEPEEDDEDLEPVECGECGYEVGNCLCIRFADPGGNSALRAAGPGNPRNLPCPTCRRPNRLTPEDVAQGYQCDSCADALERGGP